MEWTKEKRGVKELIWISGNEERFAGRVIEKKECRGVLEITIIWDWRNHKKTGSIRGKAGKQGATIPIIERELLRSIFSFKPNRNIPGENRKSWKRKCTTQKRRKIHAWSWLNWTFNERLCCSEWGLHVKIERFGFEHGERNVNKAVVWELQGRNAVKFGKAEGADWKLRKRERAA